MRLGLGLLLLLAACGPAEIEDVGQTVTGEGVLDVVPVDAMVLAGWVDSQPVEDGATVALNSSLRFAWGPDYPTDISLDDLGVWYGRFNWEGEWSPRQVASSDEQVVRARRSGDRVILELVGEGEADVRIQGEFTGAGSWNASPDDVYTLDQTVRVVVQAPDGAQLLQPKSCEGPLFVSDAAVHSSLSVVPTFDGEPQVVDNAMEGRQVAVSFALPDGLVAELPGPDQGFEGVSFHGGSGTVNLSAPTGPFETLEVVDPSAITELDLGWVVPFGDFGRDKDLVDGESYAWSEMYEFDGRQVWVVAGSPMVGERIACSIPDASWFELDAGLDAELVDEGEPWGGLDRWRLGFGAKLGATGARDLVIEAPELNGGAGVRATVSVTFTE